MQERKEIMKKIHNTQSVAEQYRLEDKLQNIEKSISDEFQQKQAQKVQEHLDAITDSEGKVNTSGAWKLRRKLCPKPLEQLTAKYDKAGNLVSNPEAIKDIYLEAYVDRLKHREISQELSELKVLREQLFQERLEIAKEKKSPPWTMDKLDDVLKKLKKGKATDPVGWVNELFTYDNIGDNLKQSLLMLLNRIKEEYLEPDFMGMANITSFWKGKGSKHNIEHERGIFILNVIRMIKDRMIYNDVKDNIKISDSQVGGRVDFNVRNHLFVIYSVLNSVVQKESPAVDIHMYDLCKCFDGLWLEECCNNLFEAGVTDDKLAMIYEGNKVNQVAVRTPGGFTDRVFINRIVTQGGVTGPLCCAVHTDAIGKDSLESGEHLYLYKGKVGIPTLAMVDDLAKISECGIDSTKDNAFINARIEQDKLLFNGPKCHQIHAGRSSNLCPLLRAHSSEIEIVSDEKYVGDIISYDGKHNKNIISRRCKGIGMCNEILSILDSLFLGSFYFPIALMLRQTMLISVLLFNAETWLRLTRENIKRLESVDEMLLRKLLGTPISTPKAALYLETGCIPLRFIIKRKRIMFLHHLLTREDDALIKRVFWAQMEKPVKGDWCLVVREDLDSLGLNLTSLTEVANKSKEQLKTLLKEQIETVSLKYLNTEKQKLSKVANHSYPKVEMQTYLVNPHMSLKQKQLAFKWRTRMIKVGWNYGDKGQCPICHDADDTQEHLFYCQDINDSIDLTDIDKNNITYNIQQHIKRLETAIRAREIMLESKH